MGVGGEWAVAAAWSPRSFHRRPAPRCRAFFTARASWARSSPRGRASPWAPMALAFLLGVLPALFVFGYAPECVNRDGSSRKAPGRRRRRQTARQFSRPADQSRLAPPGLAWLLLAAVGLGTFWAVTVAGQDLAAKCYPRGESGDLTVAQRAQFAYGIVETSGGRGPVAFGPLCAARPAVDVHRCHLLASVLVPLTCFAPRSYEGLLGAAGVRLFHAGLHAGFAIYFPELFPTTCEPRAPGFCFNGGRCWPRLCCFSPAG